MAPALTKLLHSLSPKDCCLFFIYADLSFCSEVWRSCSEGSICLGQSLNIHWESSIIKLKSIQTKQPSCYSQLLTNYCSGQHILIVHSLCAYMNIQNDVSIKCWSLNCLRKLNTTLSLPIEVAEVLNLPVTAVLLPGQSPTCKPPDLWTPRDPKQLSVLHSAGCVPFYKMLPS